MRPKSLILLALALGCGLVASIGISQVLDGNNRPAAATTPAPQATGGSLKVALKLNDPWMRAMILSPNAQDFMSTSLFGANDFRNLTTYLRKPAVSVMMTFSEDPHLGMSSEHFQGHAVVFVSTVTFSRQTASLR